jgi:hypothetical protein
LPGGIIRNFNVLEIAMSFFVLTFLVLAVAFFMASKSFYTPLRRSHMPSVEDQVNAEKIDRALAFITDNYRP